MDIFGAFQFCSIAILAAPLTVRLSRTYFYDPGRNVIFLWTILILAGLIALCVEFYRVEPTECRYDNAGRILRGVNDFFNSNATCNLICSEADGPFSPLRGGAASEIFVIPVPKRLTFNAGMLLAAGFCIPVSGYCFFLWLVSESRTYCLLGHMSEHNRGLLCKDKSNQRPFDMR
jgi:hypothetical protein